MRVAAAVVVLLGGGLIVRQTVTVPDVNEHPNHLVADDLGDLSTDQLKDVLDRFDEIVGSTTPLLDSSSDLRELNDEQLRRDLRFKGLARARQFSWEESVRRVRVIYQEVASG